MNAREFALLELDRRRLPGWPSDTIARVPRDADPPVDPRERALAERITIGTIKNLLLLQHILQHHSGRSLEQIDPLAAKIAVIGLCQLRLMDRIPASAAVDEAVEQARRLGRRRAAGFVNAVLRNATRDPNVPLPDKNSDPEAYASVALSHPPELFRRLVKLLATEDALRIAQHDNREPPTVARLFSGVTIDQLATAGVTITSHEQTGMCVVESAKRSVLARWAECGWAQVQDATAAQVVGFMDLHPGQRVLDRCAGLGTKTLQIQDALGDGAIVAIDPAPGAIDGLRRMLEIRRNTSVEPHIARLMRDVPSIPNASFDRILIDVPCSNSGVLARRPEARYAQSDRALRSLEKVQRDILDDTAPYLRSDGLLIYSTCSIWPQENERQVSWFLQRHPDYLLLSSMRTLPSMHETPAQYRDGGFVGVLRRR